MPVPKFMVNPKHVYVCYGDRIKTYIRVGVSLDTGKVWCLPITEPNHGPREINSDMVHSNIGSALNECREYHNNIIEKSKKSIKQIVEHIKDLDDNGIAGAAKYHYYSLRRYIHEISIRKRILERVCEENYVSGEPF